MDSGHISVSKISGLSTGVSPLEMHAEALKADCFLYQLSPIERLYYFYKAVIAYVRPWRILFLLAAIALLLLSFVGSAKELPDAVLLLLVGAALGMVFIWIVEGRDHKK